MLSPTSLALERIQESESKNRDRESGGVPALGIRLHPLSRLAAHAGCPDDFFSKTVSQGTCESFDKLDSLIGASVLA
jgi:hypothetical protein